MLHTSETWPVRKENEVSLQQAEMRMVRCMCGIKLQDGHVLQKEDTDWVKKCMEYEVGGGRPRGRLMTVIQQTNQSTWITEVFGKKDIQQLTL